MIALGREVVNSLLFGPSSDGRLVHDSPIRGDVWASFASAPGQSVDILIEVYRDVPTGLVASRLANRLHNLPDRAGFQQGAERASFDISFVEGFVTARVRIKELVYAILPFTAWASDLRLGDMPAEAVILELRTLVERQLATMREPRSGELRTPDPHPTIARMAATFRILAALLWAERAEDASGAPILHPPVFYNRADIGAIAQVAADLAHHVLRMRPDRLARERAAQDQWLRDETDIFSVSRNRPVELAIERSVPAIKADAVRTLFSVSCSRIGWAVLDTGIDGSHPAFKDQKRKNASRVVATYDFTRLRQIVLIDYLYNETLLTSRAIELSKFLDVNLDRVLEDLRRLALDAQDGRPINWSIAERYVVVKNPRAPDNPHGTHVAGILGGNWAPDDFVGGEPIAKLGVAPDIRFHDFRVVTGSNDDTEFALVGALQFIRYLNARNNYPQIHGANISLSIRHDVRNYACGQTPVCNEAKRTVDSGVVVVVAAGNRGYQSYNLSDGGAFETYAPSSITDPGNAEAVITVGSTHRSAPHSYGVSFFSSRGPTGDGRQKPDLVAPGEKIWSVIPGASEDALSGTSMAAPHVSGAAAMLMARNAEFIGRAAQIKEILCDSCTDLGRERSFQGAGMLDILRAMQRV